MLQIMVQLFLCIFSWFKFCFFILSDQFENRSTGSICLTPDVLTSHLYGSHRSTDGKHYIFAVEVANYDSNNEWILLSNRDASLALPTYLIVYQRRKND
jgi:hypothetical protein